MGLCAECKIKSDGWLDYRQPARLKIASGAARDDTAAGVADNRRARHDEWRNLIRQQQAAIRSICEQNHGGNQ